MPLIASRFRGLYGSLFTVFILFGTSMTIVGASLPKILSDFSWSYGVAGAVIASGAASYFLTSLAGGYVLKKLGPKATSILGLAVSATGLAFFAATPSPIANLLLNALVGGGQGLIEPTINWSVLRMDDAGSGRAMNLVHGAFSIGAVAGPIVLGLIIGMGLGWTILYRAIALLFAVLAATMLLLPFELLGRGSTERSSTGSGGPRSISRRPTYWLGFICLLLYVGTELGISNWIAEYFVRVFSTAPAVAAGMVSVFWIGLLAGRFGAPALYKGTRQEALLGLSSVLLVLSVIALNVVGYTAGVATPRWIGPALTFLAGLGCSVIYPVAISLVGASSPDAQERAVSFAVAGGGLGLFAFPFVMAWVSQAWGIKAGFTGYGALALFTCVSCYLLAEAFVREKHGRAP